MHTGLGLAFAMEMKRVYIPAVFSDEVTDKNCHDIGIGLSKYRLQCYYLPWTNCTLNDIKRKTTYSKRLTLDLSDTSIAWNEFNKSGHISSYNNQDEDVLYIDIRNKNRRKFRELIPYQYNVIIEDFTVTHKVKKSLLYYWWRAISASYIARPNHMTTELIQRYQIKDLDKLNGQCISMYVRQGNL